MTHKAYSIELTLEQDKVLKEAIKHRTPEEPDDAVTRKFLQEYVNSLIKDLDIKEER